MPNLSDKNDKFGWGHLDLAARRLFSAKVRFNSHINLVRD